LFAATLRIFGDADWRPKARPGWLTPLIVFGAVALALSVVGRDWVLSGLKICVFLAGAGSALVGIRDRRYPLTYWLSWFVTVYAVVLSLSVPLYFMSAGRSRNQVGFQGILGQPQAYGVFVAPLAVYLAVSLLTGRIQFRVHWTTYLILPWSWYSLFESGCRTALLAAGFAVLVSLSSILLLAARARVRTRLLFGVGAGAAVCVIGLMLYGGDIRDVMIGFLQKGRYSLETSLFSPEGLGGARVFQARTLFASFTERPLTGMGFGLAAAGVEQSIGNDRIIGLPVSAPTEQGILPLAVLAQIGFPGAIVLAVFLYAIAKPVMAGGRPAFIALFLTLMFVNLGELIFFALGSGGMQMWLLVAVCYEAAMATGRGQTGSQSRSSGRVLTLATSTGAAWRG